MLRDFSKYFSLNLINVLVGLCLLTYIANTLDKPDYADFGFYVSLSSIFMVCVNFGHKDSIFKFTSQGQNKPLEQALRNILFLTFAGFMVTAILWFLSFKLFALASAANLSLLLLMTLAAYKRGNGHYFGDAMLLPVYRVIWLGLCVFFAYVYKLETNLVFTASLFASLMVFILMGGINLFDHHTVKREKLFSVKNPTFVKYFAIEIVAIALARFDMILLNLIGDSSEQIADYFFSVQVYEAIMLIVTPIAFLYFNNLNQKDLKIENTRLLKRSLLLLLITILSGASLWQMVGEDLLSFIFPNYTSAFSLLTGFIFLAFFSGINLIFASNLYANNKEKTYLIISVFGVFLLTLLSLLLIPLSGALGAFWSRIFAEAVISVVLITSYLVTSKK